MSQNNDLISRSALLKNKTRMTEYDESGCGVHVFVVKEEDVLDAPAVDAEPVRHGRWMPTEIRKSFGTLNGFKCSLCDKERMTRENYCPKCGGKMDAEVQNDA